MTTFSRSQANNCPQDVLYRIESRRISGGFDEAGNLSYGGSYSELCVREYPVIKATPRGKWIIVNGERKFVLNESRKRFAVETMELAMASFRARKERQISILKARLTAAHEELALSQPRSAAKLSQSSMESLSTIELTA